MSGLLPHEDVQSRSEIYARLEGKTLARLIVDAEPHRADDSPTGGDFFGLEFSDATRLLIFSSPDVSPTAPALFILAPRLILNEGFIWTPTHTRRLRSNRHEVQEQYLDEIMPTKAGRIYGQIQRRAEGQVIAHFRLLPEQNRFGGEQLLVNFASRDALLVEAVPSRVGLASQFGMTWVPSGKIFNTSLIG